MLKTLYTQRRACAYTHTHTHIYIYIYIYNFFRPANFLVGRMFVNDPGNTLSITGQVI